MMEGQYKMLKKNGQELSGGRLSAPNFLTDYKYLE